MKKFTFLLIGLLALISCNKEEDPFKGESCMKTEESFTNDNGTALNLTMQEWWLEENTIGGVNVEVTITGTIVGDSAFVRGYGDGLIGETKIKLNKKKEFNQKFGNFFTSSPLSEEYINGRTVITVFNGQDTLMAEINSCPLKNVQYR